MVDQTLPEPEPGFTLGISVSHSHDLGRLGLTETHLRMALGEVARATLMARGWITYGGHLEPQGYTTFLIHECEKYGARNRPFTGCVPWPVHAQLSADEIRSLKRDVGLLGRYVYLDADGQVIDGRENTSGPAGEPVDAETTVRSLTGLRVWMTEHTDGRLVLGGQRSGYQGRIPGVIEETILSIRAGKPVFVAGGFGGAAGDAVTVLGLDPEGWLGLPDRSAEPDLIELAAAAAETGWNPTSNGLTLEQNRQLAISYRASEIASLVVLGLTDFGSTHD